MNTEKILSDAKDIQEKGRSLIAYAREIMREKNPDAIALHTCRLQAAAGEALKLTLEIRKEADI